MGRAGKVSVESHNGNLRLRWSHWGQRYCMAMNMSDSPVARTVADRRAGEIQGDLLTGNFDPSLTKYQSQSGTATPVPLTSVELFRRFTANRAKTAKGRDMERFRAIGGHITQYFGTRSASVGDDFADGFRLYLLERLAPGTAKGYLVLVRSCWDWGVKQHLIMGNPWGEVLKRVKIPPKQPPRPFSTDEIAAIRAGFKSSRHYSYYEDFTAFLFGTGCRTGEAIGLRWGHLSDDCDRVWIGESVSRGVRNATKTNRARDFRLGTSVRAMLLNRRPVGWEPDGLVFPALKGGAIDGHNFSNRAWKSVLKAAEVPHRKAYSTRHTYICHALAKGVNPMTIAQMTGHDPETLFKFYAAHIDVGAPAMDIFA
jgi:integrase